MSDAKPKLLIVEDDAGLQAQLKWAWPDFEVIQARDRTEAIAALRSEEPDVVTLDLGLPPDPDGTSEGFAVLDAIMELKSDTKVIVASGHGARESVLSAIAKGAYDFYQKPVDIEALGLIVRRALRLKQIEVAATRHALEQVLLHLVQNAIEASAGDSPVFVRVGKADTHGEIEVLDSGHGMSPEFVRTRLFKPFDSTKSGGFGIGAYEARELVRAMGGRLEVESREAFGTRFIIRLPLSETAAVIEALAQQGRSKPKVA